MQPKKSQAEAQGGTKAAKRGDRGHVGATKVKRMLKLSHRGHRERLGRALRAPSGGDSKYLGGQGDPNGPTWEANGDKMATEIVSKFHAYSGSFWDRFGLSPGRRGAWLF